jgi:hypothetical protein
VTLITPTTELGRPDRGSRPVDNPVDNPGDSLGMGLWKTPSPWGSVETCGQLGALSTGLSELSTDSSTGEVASGSGQTGDIHSFHRPYYREGMRTWRERNRHPPPLWKGPREVLRGVSTERSRQTAGRAKAKGQSLEEGKAYLTRTLRRGEIQKNDFDCSGEISRQRHRLSRGTRVGLGMLVGPEAPPTAEPTRAQQGS